MSSESAILQSPQERLIAAVQDLSLVRSLAAIQKIVRHAAREIVGADGATFVLRDGDKCFYADEDAISPLWKGQRFPMSVCVSGWTMLNAREVVIPDIYQDPRIPADAYRPTFVKSLVMVPIRKTVPIGAIGAYWAHEYEATEGEVSLLQALANTTSVAMENVRVYSELEERVERRTRQLEDLNRELEAFSYSVSHDLRAPLRAIGGFAELLARELGGQASAAALGCLEKIQRNTVRMDQLTEDLLKLARLARCEVHSENIDLVVIAREVVDRFRQAEPNRDVDFRTAESLPARCDPGLISVVLENLLSNAWKYTAKTEKAKIEIGCEKQDGKEVVFFVRDNGAGFDQQYATRLFTPFQRLHTAAEFPGTGIGLATAHRIVAKHGGRIWASAEPGRGATFFFTCSSVGASDEAPKSAADRKETAQRETAVSVSA